MAKGVRDLDPLVAWLRLSKTEIILFFVILFLLVSSYFFLPAYEFIFYIFLLTYLVSDGGAFQRILTSVLIVLLFQVTIWFLPGLYEEKVKHFYRVGGGYSSIALALISLGIIMPVIFVPTRSLMRRLLFLYIGVAIIFGLSEVSKQVEHLRTVATTVETH
jgi:hypothetical protein